MRDMVRYQTLSKLLPAFLLAVGACAQSPDGPGITLAEDTGLALKNNLRTQIAREGITESRARQGVARSAPLPKVSGIAYR